MIIFLYKIIIEKLISLFSTYELKINTILINIKIEYNYPDALL